MKKNYVIRDMIFLLTSGLLTVSIWAGFEIYRAYTKPAPVEGVDALLEPLTPQLNTAILTTLEQREP